MDIRDTLHYDFVTRIDNPKTKEKQLFNIERFSSLDRKQNYLRYQKIERRLLLHTTKNQEKIYIQYPGKEAARENKQRPWDFRPKVYYGIRNTAFKDLSFSEIWDDISQMQKIDAKVLSEFAAVLFRLAYMINHERVEDDYIYEDIDMSNNTIIAKGKEHFVWYKPVISQQTLEYFDSKIGKIRDISIEAYVLFNDLLAQNEDCKYFYRDAVEKGTTWKGTPGRINTLLTHLSVIEYLQGNIRFSQIMDRFNRGMGVAPIPNKSIDLVTDGIIKR